MPTLVEKADKKEVAAEVVRSSEMLPPPEDMVPQEVYESLKAKFLEKESEIDGKN